MYKNFTIILFCILLVLNSCTNKEKLTNHRAIELDIDNDIVSVDRYSSLFSNFSIIPLEKTEDFIIGRINDIFIHDSVIYLSDCSYSKSVYLFDMNGKFIKQIKAVGKGPGEYMRLVAFDLDVINNQMLLLTDSPSQVLIYDLSGKFIRNLKLDKPVSDLTFYNNKYFVSICAVNPDRKPFPGYLASYKKNGSKSKSYFNSSIFNKGNADHQILEYGNFFRTETDVKYILPYNDTIYSIKGDNILPYIIFKSKNTISQGEFEKLKSPFIELIRLGKLQNPGLYLETKDAIYFEILCEEYMTMVYNKNSKKKYRFTYTSNDLTYANPKFLNVYNDKLAGYIDPIFAERFKSHVKDGSVVIPEEQRKQVLNFTENSNPILVFYEFKKSDEY